MTKRLVQKPKHRTTQKHVEHHDATDIEKKTYIFRGFFSLFFIYNFLNEIAKNC